MGEACFPSRLLELNDATRCTLERLETAEAAADRRGQLERLRAHYAALRQVETSHLEPLLLNQDATRHQAMAYRKACGRVTPMVEALERTSVTDPAFDRLLGRFVDAFRRVLDRGAELLNLLDRLLSAEHRQVLSEAIADAVPASLYARA